MEKPRAGMHRHGRGWNQLSFSGQRRGWKVVGGGAVEATSGLGHIGDKHKPLGSSWIASSLVALTGPSPFADEVALSWFLHLALVSDSVHFRSLRVPLFWQGPLGGAEVAGDSS